MIHLYHVLHSILSLMYIKIQFTIKIMNFLCLYLSIIRVESTSSVVDPVHSTTSPKRLSYSLFFLFFILREICVRKTNNLRNIFRHPLVY